MLMLWKNRTTLRGERETENGFTLLELMVVVVVIGILSALAFLVASDQVRQAIIATVKGDVSTNKSVMAPGAGIKIYSPVDKFIASAASTDENETFYVLSPDESEACTHTVRKFSDDDIVVYRFWTKIGNLEADYCPDLGGSNESTTPEDETPPAGETGTGGEETTAPTPEPTETPGEPENGDTEIETDPITPNNSLTVIDVNIVSNETYRVCYVVKINTTSTTGAPWSIRIDRTVPPFHSPNFLDESGNDSRYVMQDFGSYYTLHGTGALATASVSKSFSPRICVKAPNNNAIIDDLNPAQVTNIGVPSGGKYNGQQSFTVLNSSQFYSGWSVEVDLKDLRDLVSAKPTSEPSVYTSSEIKIVKVSGTIYRVSTPKMTPALNRDKPFTFIVGLG